MILLIVLFGNKIKQYAHIVLFPLD